MAYLSHLIDSISITNMVGCKIAINRVCIYVFVVYVPPVNPYSEYKKIVGNFEYMDGT